ncbi:MAG: hypothetical protein AB7T10_05240 [bacterium]
MQKELRTVNFSEKANCYPNSGCLRDDSRIVSICLFLSGADDTFDIGIYDIQGREVKKKGIGEI